MAAWMMSAMSRSDWENCRAVSATVASSSCGGVWKRGGQVRRVGAQGGVSRKGPSWDQGQTHYYTKVWSAGAGPRIAVAAASTAGHLPPGSEPAWGAPGVRSGPLFFPRFTRSGEKSPLKTLKQVNEQKEDQQQPAEGCLTKPKAHLARALPTSQPPTCCKSSH